MPKPEFTIKFIKDTAQTKLLSERLNTLDVFAIDIETSEWWNRRRERIALIQFAYRVPGSEQIRIVILDPLANINLKAVRSALENPVPTKIIHNASFDAVRLQKHYNFHTASIHDTMLAARRNKERKYSLKAQAEIHLGLWLNKESQKSDWSRRPLSREQLYYAALDPYAALLLYEDQIKRGLTGSYRLKPPPDKQQIELPLEKPSPPQFSTPSAEDIRPDESDLLKTDLSAEEIALLGIISELPTRYSPDSLIASIESRTRVGLAGWIIDMRLGEDAEPDEETIKEIISILCGRELIEVTDTRRLKATSTGKELWEILK